MEVSQYYTAAAIESKTPHSPVQLIVYTLFTGFRVLERVCTVSPLAIQIKAVGMQAREHLESGIFRRVRVGGDLLRCFHHRAKSGVRYFHAGLP